MVRRRRIKYSLGGGIMNLSQIRGQVQLNLTNPFITRYGITEDFIDQKTNQYYRLLAFDTKTVENNYTYTTIAETYSLPLDNEFQLIKRVLYDYISGTQQGYELQEVTPGYSSDDEDQGTYDTGTPSVYWLEQPHTKGKGKIWFNPPLASGKIVRIYAIKYPKLVTGESGTFQLKDIFETALVQGVTKELGAIGEGIPNLKYFENNYLYNLEKIKEILFEPSANRRRKVSYRESWQ
jgi:hypothetical protein